MKISREMQDLLKDGKVNPLKLFSTTFIQVNELLINHIGEMKIPITLFYI